MNAASHNSNAEDRAPAVGRGEVVAVCNTRPDNVTPNTETSRNHEARKRASDARTAPEARPRSETDVSVIASGIDTLYLFSRATVAHTEFRRLEKAQEQARANEVQRAKAPTLDFAGHYFAMHPRGARTAPYKLESEHAALLVNPSAVSTFPTFTAELRSIFLWQKGARFAATQAENVASQILLRMTPDDARLHVGRVDLAVDFQGWEPCESDVRHFVTRAHHRSSWAERGVFTGFSFGRGDLAARLYCKTIEIEHSRKAWFRKVWAESPAYDPSRPVWRLEFQLRRPAIVGIEVERAAASLDTWEDVLGNAQGIWRYLSRRWLAMKKQRTKSSRQNFHPAWDALSKTGFSAGPWAGTDADLYRTHRADSATRVTGQVAGYLTRALAEVAFHESAERIVEPTLEDALPAIVRAVRRHTEKRGHSIEDRAQERVATWLAVEESMAMNEALRIREPGEDDDREAA
jgi:hypothetical protein